jgi:hypothetical protein
MAYYDVAPGSAGAAYERMTLEIRHGSLELFRTESQR